MEWKNQWNSFNSLKGLLYSKWYQAIRDWKDGKIDSPLPPVEASLDPINQCNLNCSHCNAHKYLVENKINTRIPDDHLMNLIGFLGEWGVKATCFGGGGEPTLHTKLEDALYLCKKVGMESSIATNGIAFTDELIEAMAKTCRWVGISVDAGTKETYIYGRKRDAFDIAINNIKKLSEKVKELNTNCDVAFKFLIMPHNQHEIFRACVIAKEIGVKDFHVRPADFSHQGMGELRKKENSYDVGSIKEQFAMCHQIENGDFRTFTVMHKFSDDFKPVKRFSQCVGSPCCIQLCPNGDVYLCPDQRYSERYLLGKHSPDPKKILDFWGKEKHYNLVFKEGKDNCNTRCTFNPYNEQCEKLFISDKDPMCKNFI